MTTDKLMKQSHLKWIVCAGLLAMAAGCSEDQSDQMPADDNAVSEPAMEATDSEDTAASDSAAAENDSSASSDTGGAASGDSERHTVTARSTAYDPMVLKIKAGDSVSWVNMSGHNNNFEEGNIPEGAEPWKTRMGEDVNRTFDQEGIYLYKCDPHFALGMVGAIIVGEPVNLEQVENNAKGMYKRALAKAKQEIE